MTKCPICSNSHPCVFSQINKYRYYQCFQCQTLFLSPQPTDKFLTNYYRKNFDYQNGLLQEKNIRKRAKIILNNLTKLNPSGKTFLDVGSGYGFFLDEAKKFKLKTLGLEPSKKLYLHSQHFNYLNNQSVTINQTFEKFYDDNKKSKFDFITVIHVIEHLKNPKYFIKDCFNLLNPDGILYIETPNLDSHLFHTEKENYTFLTPPDHLWLFSLNSFKTLLSPFCSNLILNRSKTYSYPEHLMGILKSNFQFLIFNFHSRSNFKIINKKADNKNSNNLVLKIKIIIFDKFLARILTPLLNIGGKGSILELYIKKKN